MGETTGEGPGGKPPVWPGMTQVTVGGIGSPGREEAAKLAAKRRRRGAAMTWLVVLVAVAGIAAIAVLGWKHHDNGTKDAQTATSTTPAASCDQERAALADAIAHHKLVAAKANPTQAELVAGGYLTKPTTDAKTLATAVDAWRRAPKASPTEAQLVAAHDLKAQVADWDLSPTKHEIYPSASGRCHVADDAALVEHYRQIYLQSSNGTFSGDQQVIDSAVQATHQMCDLSPTAFAQNIRDYSIEKPDHIQERGEITHILCPWRLPEFQKADTRHSYTW